ncbi:MAG: response regulator transcription factor [Syntrophaceae bacterium]
MPAIKILLADDHEILREGLRRMIEKEPDMEVIGEAEDGRNIVKIAKKLVPDVIVMDVTMPDLNGMDATRKIVSEVPGVKVLALSMHQDRKYVSGMLEAGAMGYVLKGSKFEELVTAIRAVSKKNVYLSPKIADMVLSGYLGKSPKTFALPVLSDREREVLQLLAEGNSVKETAYKLELSPKTVETHRRHIMEKLNISNSSDIVKYALREGLITLDL